MTLRYGSPGAPELRFRRRLAYRRNAFLGVVLYAIDSTVHRHDLSEETGRLAGAPWARFATNSGFPGFAANSTPENAAA